MIDTKLSELYSELGRVMSQTAAFQRELASVSDTDYHRQGNLHRAISEAMARISRIKGQITELELPNEPEIAITVMNGDELAELSKVSPEVGIGYDSNRGDWRFRVRSGGKRRTIARASTHNEIVALKQEWEQQ